MFRNFYFKSIVIFYSIDITTYCNQFHQNGLRSRHNCHRHNGEECNFHYCTWILQLYKVLELVLYLQSRRQTLLCHSFNYTIPKDSTIPPDAIGKITTRVTLEICRKAPPFEKDWRQILLVNSWLNFLFNNTNILISFNDILHISTAEFKRLRY